MEIANENDPKEQLMKHKLTIEQRLTGARKALAKLECMGPRHRGLVAGMKRTFAIWKNIELGVLNLCHTRIAKHICVSSANFTRGEKPARHKAPGLMRKSR